MLDKEHLGASAPLHTAGVCPRVRRNPIPLDIVVLWALVLSAATAASAEECRPDLRAQSKVEYQWRGGFCEGVCKQAVSSEVFELGSLHFRPEGASLESIAGNGELTLRWQPPPATQSLRLRIRSLSPFQCYRLDASLDAESTSFTWPIRLARHLELTSGAASLDLGFLLEAEASDGTRTWVPISFGAASSAFEVVVMHGADPLSTFSDSSSWPFGASWATGEWPCCGLSEW